MTPTPRSIRTVLPFIFGLIGCLFLAVLNQERGFDLWRNYALTGLAQGIPVTWILWRTNVRLPHYIQWFIVAAVWLHYGGGSLGSPNAYQMGLFGYHGINGAYHVHDWWDHLTHAMGVGSGTMAAAFLIEIYQTRRRLGWTASEVWLVSAMLGLTMGVGVELFEYLGKTVFQTIDQGGYVNTMRDLHFNIYGAAAGGGLAAFVNRRKWSERIQAQVGSRQSPLVGNSWRERLPPGIAGLLAFAAPPFGMTILLALRFVFQSEPVEVPGSYDNALQAMLVSAVIGILLGPAVTLWRRQAKAAGETA